MRILHVFRTPVGGLFRHVRDLARGQKELGHDVGILCDSATGGETAVKLLKEAEPFCSLGIARVPISRMPGTGDVAGAKATRAHLLQLNAGVVHGHGAKGGLYARLAARKTGARSFYTPHGGSLHYNWSSPTGAAFLSVEKWLARIGDGLLFVCDFERAAFDRKIGLAGKPNIVVHNGLWPQEFQRITPGNGATDLLFVGDMRLLKGVDVLLDAILSLKAKSRVTATLVGDGPDLERFKAAAAALGDAVSFRQRMPIQEAFRFGRIFVVPSRAESFPYVVLEAAAASVPMIASNVGGIPEILPGDSLVEPGSVPALAQRVELALSDPQKLARGASELAASTAQRFGALTMARRITQFYSALSG
jgi:glycosyltransferase involved in cell wall biosynthesis